MMRMINFQRVVWVFIILPLSIAACGSKSGSTKATKPNIIFLLTDDQRFDALGCMGNSEIKTPRIDELASKGLVFTNYYNTTAICMASRATIMTGMYEFKTGCNFQHGPLTQDKFESSYPVLLREAGYRTGFAGKFGFGVVPGDTKSNSNWHSHDRMPMDKFDWWRGWPGQGKYETADNEFMEEYAEEYPHVTRALGTAAADFIRESGDQDKPFCLSVSFKAPHSPVRPDPEYDHVYEGKTFTKPCNYGVDAAVHLPDQSKSDRQFKKLGKRWVPKNYDEAMAQYYQLIYGVDVAVGMILDELKELGLDDNTIIIFTTDNGYFCGSHGFGGKVLPYEEGSRAPLIIFDPRSESAGKGKTCNA
ncbi:MAG: sulfatase-like hydrolase/transferase, partial [Bacteroidales bacterium]|nr:sulfatase-like hydrolase/transferase [Bacteroidales bacterium]